MKHIENSFSLAMCSAGPLTHRYDEKNIIVTAATGSLLGRCTEVLRQSIERSPQGTVNADAYSAFVVTSSTEPSEITGYSEFSARVIETAQKASEAVSRELFHARNTVKPLVDELTERMCERDSTLTENPLTGIEIVRRSTPTILLHPSLMASYSRAKETVLDITPRNFRLPVYEDNEVIPMLRTGSKELDEAIGEYFTAKGNGWLSTVWKNVFTASGEPSRDGLRTLLFGRNNVDIALFVFLIARQLWQNPIKDINMPSAEFEEAMVHYRDQAAVALCAEIEVLAREEKIGTLIYSNSKGRLEVWDKPYREFIAKEGDNETLLGFSISGDEFLTTDQILEKKELYKTMWARYENLNKATFDNRRFNAMKEGLLLEFQYMMQNSSETEFPLPLRECAKSLFCEEVEKLCFEDIKMKNLALTCMRLICRSRFPGMNCEEILEGIHQQKMDNPSIDVREAVAIVTMELIARFYAQFMRKMNPGEVTLRM